MDDTKVHGELARDPADAFVFIGKERGKLWSEVDTGFLRWMLDKDFDEDAIFTAKYWLNERAKAASA